MADNSMIEWTDATWNPVLGCTKISAGCAHCYAERLTERFRGVPGRPVEKGFDLRLAPARIDQPRRWRKPRRIFVNSMSDLFHPGVPEAYIAEVGRVMKDVRRHTHQVLTKRHDRMRRILSGELSWMGKLPNVWYGVRVENRSQGLPRLDALREAPGTMRFASVEPLLEDLGDFNLKFHRLGHRWRRERSEYPRGTVQVENAEANSYLMGLCPASGVRACLFSIRSRRKSR